MNYLAIISLVLKYAGPIESAIAMAMSNVDLVTKIKEMSGELATIVEGIGSALFPKAAPELHIAAGIIASFDENFTKWLQGSLNSYLALNPPLVVDGIYGPKTIAAVEAFQTKIGLTVDGFAGQITQAALRGLLTKVIPSVQAVANPTSKAV